MHLILPFNADAAKTMFTTGGNTGTLSLVGLVTTETVAIQIPRVASPDATNDDHWTALVQEDEAVTLRAGHNVTRIPASLLLRLEKDAGVEENPYGVRFS